LVQLLFCLVGLLARGCVAVVDGDERNSHRLADAGYEGDVCLSTTFDDGDSFPIRVVSEGLEHKGESESLGEAFDEDGGLREEELAAGGVELGVGAELIVRREGVGLDEAGADIRLVLGQDQLGRATLRKEGEWVE